MAKLSKNRGLAIHILEQYNSGIALNDIRRNLLRKGYGEGVIRKSIMDLEWKGLLTKVA